MPKIQKFVLKIYDTVFAQDKKRDKTLSIDQNVKVMLCMAEQFQVIIYYGVAAVLTTNSCKHPQDLSDSTDDTRLLFVSKSLLFDIPEALPKAETELFSPDIR